MKFIILYLVLISVSAFADTPPPNTVKAKTYSGDGVTPITATGTALDVNVVNSSTNTVNQGDAGSESWLVAVTSSALPTNACVETGGHLASIDSKTPALGQALAAGSVPVVLTAAQISTLTPPSSVAVNNFPTIQLVSVEDELPSGTNTIGAVNINGTVPISGTITATNSANGTTALPVPVQATQVGGVDGSGNLRAIKVSSTGVLSVDASGSTVPVSGTFFQATQPVSGTFFQATQPVSGTVAATQSGSWTVSTTSAPSALTIHQAAVSIGTTATRLTYNGSAPAATRVLLVAQLISSSVANCFFGSSGVTSSSSSRGVQMFPGQVFSFSNDAADYFAICDTASQTFFITEQE